MFTPPHNHSPSYRHQQELNPYQSHKNDEKPTLSISDTNNPVIHVTNNPIIDIINGYNHSVMIHLADNTMMVYGYNAHGQLGLNHFDYINHTEITPIGASFNIYSGISAKHSLLITDNKLYGAGNNVSRQIGMTEANTVSKWTQIKSISVENIKDCACSSKFSTFLMRNGDLYQTTDQYPYIQLIKTDIKFKAIASGKSHVLLISENDELYAFGLNNWGQLGIDTGIKQCKLPLKVTFFDQMAIKIDCIACGQDHSMVLTQENEIYCFGRNDCCQIGNGSNHTNIINIPQRNETLQHHIDHKITDIKCGDMHNLIKTENGEYWLWGRNRENQCLIKCDREFIKVPTIYKYEGIEILDMFLGHKATQIVFRNQQRFQETKDETLNKEDINALSESSNRRNSGNKKRNNFQIKLNKFKKWYKKWKGGKKQKNNNIDANTNQLQNIHGLSEYKYINHQLVKCDDNNNNNEWYYSLNNSMEEIAEIESNTENESSFSASNYAEICYYSPKSNKPSNIKHGFTNIVKLNSFGNDTKYHPMTSKEC